MSRTRLDAPLATTVLGAAALLTLAAPANAITITLEYNTSVDDAVTCGPGWDCNGGTDDPTGDLGLHMAVAAAFWEDIIEDPHVLHIRYSFSSDGSPSANVIDVDGNGRPTLARIRIPADLPYFYDPTPTTHDEFDMTPKLYRDVLPVEQNEAFIGVPPPVMEVGFNGRWNGPNQGLDLLTIIIHEMGHALGLEPDVYGFGGSPPCEAPSQPYYFPDPSLFGGGIMGIKAFELNDGSFDCSHLAAGGITACNGLPDEDDCKAHQALMWPGALPSRRALPGTVDIMAVATAAGWQQVEFPRKFSLGGGAWSNNATWLGDRVPDSNDPVYILNEAPTTVHAFANAVARDITLTGSNFLDIVFGTTDVGGVVDVQDDAAVQVSFGAVLEASRVELAPDAGLFIAHTAVADVFRLESRGEVVGAGILDVVAMDNRGRLEATAGGAGIFEITGPNPLDLDGETFESGAMLIAQNGDLVINAHVADPVNAALLVGPGHAIDFIHGWEQPYTGVIAHRIELDGSTATAALGGDVTLNGRTNVTGTGHFLDDVTLESLAEVSLAPGATLRFNGLTDYDGGSIAGDGTVQEHGGVRVLSDTTLGPLDLYDMDGPGDTSVLVLPGADFVIDADRIDTNPAADGYDGTLSIDGNLIVNTTDPWRLEGTALFNLTGGQVGTIAGSPVILTGGMSILESGIIQAEITIESGAFVHTIDAAATALVSGGGTSRILGGAFTGDGNVQVVGPTRLEGFGTIEPDVQIAGSLRATGGWLVVEGDVTHMSGVVGPADDTGVLWITPQWSTSTGLLHIRDGWIAGGSIDNTGTTTGHGFVSVPSFTNRGLVNPGANASGDGGTGAGGILAFTDNYRQTADGELRLEIGGLALETYDGLIIDGSAVLDGTLALERTPTFFPSLGDTLPLMSWNGRTGQFANVTGTALPGALAWELSYEANILRLTVVEGCAGDADGNGVTDFVDLVLVLSSWGPCPGAPAGCPADVTHDGVVDFADLIEVLSGWGGCA